MSSVPRTQLDAASPTLLVLHGAGGSGETMSPLANPLRSYARIETPNLIGHGGRPIPPKFSVREWADDVVAYMDKRNIARAFICGYSFGGYIALYLARHYPERVRGVCTLAAKYVFDRQTVRLFTWLVNPERIKAADEVLAAEFAATNFPENWMTVMAQHAFVFSDLGMNPAIADDDLRAISVPVLLISSDQDQLVSAAETIAISDLLPAGQVWMFRGQGHPLTAVPCEVIARVIGNWMTHVLAGRTPDLASL